MRRLSIDPVFEAAPEPPMRPCDHPGCAAGGAFPAPKSRVELHRYLWFCLEHVRQYNLAWNYYAGMSDREIEAEIRHDTVWQRPSWRLGVRHGPFGVHLRDPLGLFGDPPRPDRERRRDRGAPRRTLSEREQALAVFDMEPPFTLVHLKARYKALVKEYHPDAHGGDRAAEERLKAINQAYGVLKACYFS